MSRGALRHHDRIDTAPNGLELEAMPRPATARSLFNNDNPLCVEIGSGKGSFLLAQARAYPERNYLGIERTLRYWRFAADRFRRHGLKNALMVHGDAREMVSEVLVDSSVSEFHIYFPDPWPKTRHQRRRLVQPDVVELMARRLSARGRLQVVTDHTDYFEQIQRVIRESSLIECDFVRPESANSEEMTGTNFERKYAAEGRPFFAIAALKTVAG